MPRINNLKLMIFGMILGSANPIICSAQEVSRTQLNFKKNLFPEGIAIDSVRNRLFLKSLKNSKIVSCKIDGTDSMNFIEAGDHEFFSGFGMTVERDTLYALGNELVEANNKSILLMGNSITGEFIAKYTYKAPQLTYFNDLAIRSNNEIFITDSESNKVFRIRRPNKEIEIFLESEEIAYSNGIAISSDSKLLYLASQKGIRSVKIETKAILNKSNEENMGNDELKIFKNSLIGIVNVWSTKPENNGIFRYFLNPEGREVVKKEKLLAFSEEYKFPTTFGIVGNELYFLMNTQLDNFDEKSKTTIDISKLKPYKLIEIALQ